MLRVCLLEYAMEPLLLMLLSSVSSLFSSSFALWTGCDGRSTSYYVRGAEAFGLGAAVFGNISALVQKKKGVLIATKLLVLFSFGQAYLRIECL